MTAKDNSLYEVRKHNDFSALLSDDEEAVQSASSVTKDSSATQEIRVAAAASSETPDSTENDGFETFTAARKVKRHSQSKPTAMASRLPPKPKEIVVPKAENSIELYDFPSTLKTNDIRKFLHDFDGNYRLKWINDTSCYVVFDEDSLGKRNQIYLINYLFILFISFYKLNVLYLNLRTKTLKSRLTSSL